MRDQRLYQLARAENRSMSEARHNRVLRTAFVIIMAATGMVLIAGTVPGVLQERPPYTLIVAATLLFATVARSGKMFFKKRSADHGRVHR